jgi:hypothetical protein
VTIHGSSTSSGAFVAAHKSTIALECAKINPTLVNGFAWMQWNLRPGRKSSVSKTDRLGAIRRPGRDKDLRYVELAVAAIR